MYKTGRKILREGDQIQIATFYLSARENTEILKIILPLTNISATNSLTFKNGENLPNISKINTSPNSKFEHREIEFNKNEQICN